ncbi:Glutamate decarboxylase and related PLP-dependent protein [Solimicrobium silvestre]|uniref:Glutamate decarboxylase and related PLP-dependent protein n=2 Tax=Solimicrobium silvestre TaxID=2099400 RepID=A0A2S9GUW0_9BURK|nr:Glutamate decarboxylase and related PLP-dependent protein [Solimicrobium silvestre]
MLEDMLNYAEQLRERPVWQPIPQSIHDRFQENLPQQGTELALLHQRFLTEIMPYSIGNAHPGFMGWVQGGGTPVGMVAEMLAAGLNANVGGREQVPISVEKQILRWMRELFQFPETANGLFVTGTSLANLIAVLIARTTHLGVQARRDGIAHGDKKLTAYTSAGAHGSVSQAMDLAGFGTAALRPIPMNAAYQLDLDKLRAAIQTDKAAGFEPFLIIGSAGTVDVGAIDDLTALANIAQAENCWFHVDGAYGALGMLSPQIAPRLCGIERASSIAFDFHKWGQVPYDAGYILVRDGAQQLATFSAPAHYLKRETRGMAAGSPWPCDLGPDLSRGFRALKTWFTIATFGAEKLGQIINNTCELAQYLKQRVEQEPQLELLAPVNLNIVCFRYVGTSKLSASDLNNLNTELVIRLQESGVVAPSSTLIQHQFAIRAAIVNHRTTRLDMDNLINTTLLLGGELGIAATHP